MRQQKQKEAYCRGKYRKLRCGYSARWTDESLVINGKLITSRNPDDVPNFIDAISQELTR
jgi:putative intracellular protease/amidase